MTETHEPQGFFSKYIFSRDHKTIAIQYLITGLVMALVGGVFAAMFRMHLAVPAEKLISYEQYNAFVTQHGTIMVFWVAMPILIGAFGNFCIPLMIGARDMAFPTLNMISFWTFLLSAVVLIASFFVPGGAFGGGWTGYPPLSANPEFSGVYWGFILWVAALALEFVSVLMGGVNYVTTTINMRTRGMTLMRMPLLVWMELIASVIFMLSIGPLIVGAGMLLMDFLVGTHFFRVTARGKGDPLLWQHLFWFFGHPEVYVILLPGLGILAEVFTSFSRKPFFAYKAVIYSTLAAGFISFIVWAHHMFVSGLNPTMATAFSITTIIISIPFFIVMVSFALTLWGGSLRFDVPFLFALGAFATFIIGGITGLFLGAETSDIYFHDTYFVTAHFHYTLFPTSILAMMAGIYYWFPKMFGRMMSATLGKIHFWGTLIFFNLFAFPMYFIGIAGNPRRYYSTEKYGYLKDVQWLHQLATAAAILLLLVQFVFIYNFFKSMLLGEKADKNPWKSSTLEWLAESPPPHGNWGSKTPEVVNGPYAYAVEGAEDFQPQGKL